MKKEQDLVKWCIQSNKVAYYTRTAECKLILLCLFTLPFTCNLHVRVPKATATSSPENGSTTLMPTGKVMFEIQNSSAEHHTDGNRSKCVTQKIIEVVEIKYRDPVSSPQSACQRRKWYFRHMGHLFHLPSRLPCVPHPLFFL